MANTFEVAGYQPELSQIVNGVLAVMFSDSAEPLPAESPVAIGYAASVSFVGEWKGALLLRCGIATAEMLTRRLLKSETISPGDVSDAMGELANMIGGNLKSVLPPGVLLSVPHVALGNELAVRVCGGNETQSTVFSCNAGSLEVTLIRVRETPAPVLRA